MSTKKIEFNVKGIERIKYHYAGVEPFVVEKCTNHTMEGVMAVYNRAEYETQRIEAAHKMQALVMQIITHSETN